MHANGFTDYFTIGAGSTFLGPAVAAAIIAAISAWLLKQRDDKWRREDRAERKEEQAKEEVRKLRERQEDFHTALAKEGPMGARAVVYELGAQLMLETEVALPQWSGITPTSLDELDSLWSTWQVARIERRLEIYGSDTCYDRFRDFLSGHNAFRSALDDAIFLLYKPNDNAAPWKDDPDFKNPARRAALIAKVTGETKRELHGSAQEMANARSFYILAMRHELFPQEVAEVSSLDEDEETAKVNN